MYWDVHPGMESIAGGSKRLLSMTIFAMQAFGATDLCLIGNPEIEHGYTIQHKEYPDLESVLDDYPDAKLVALVGEVPWGINPTLLFDYLHPDDNVLYIIGADYGDIEFEKIEHLDVDYVHIETKNNVNHLWSCTVAGIVLYDRWSQWQ